MADPNTGLLTTSDGQPAAGKPLVLPKNGLALQLELAVGHKLDSASLTLIAGEDEELTAVITSDQDLVQNGEWPTQPVNWLMADWGVDRPLTAIQIHGTTGGKARLKVYTAGAWIPLYPIDIIATGVEQFFSPVLASKVMVELVKTGEYPGVWLPNPTVVTGVTLKATSQPYDVSIAVADRPAFFQHGSLLPSATPINVEGLVEAINAYLDEPGHSLPIPLRLQATIPGMVKITFSATTLTEARQLDNTAPDNTLTIPWQEAAVGRITIGDKATLKAIRFTPAFELQPEELYLAPAAAGAAQAQLCAPQRRLAQGFHVRLQEAAITGLDLYLYPRSSELEANLSLHPDLHGRPGPSPYGGSVIPIRWQGETFPQGRWLSCQFPQPVQIKDENWWLVLDVSKGEVLWALAGDGPPGVNGCLYQIGASAWLPRRLSSAGSAWAYTRVRVSKPGPKSLKSIVLRRGEKSLPCSMDAEGRVQPGEKDLTTLNQNTGPLLEIAIEAESAGMVSLRDLRILSAG